MIQEERICNLNKRSPSDNPYIIYWMQNAQRTEYNHALEFAIRLSNENKKPLIVLNYCKTRASSSSLSFTSLKAGN